jgi:hypothetical protein
LIEILPLGVQVAVTHPEIPESCVATEIEIHSLSGAKSGTVKKGGHGELYGQILITFQVGF